MSRLRAHVSAPLIAVVVLLLGADHSDAISNDRILQQRRCSPSIEIIDGEQMRVDLADSSVSRTSDPNAFDLHLTVEIDNRDPDNVPNGYKRWYHCAVACLPTEKAAIELRVKVSGAQWGKADQILPVWSLDMGKTYVRLPSSTVMRVVGRGGTEGFTWFFNVTVPVGVSQVRLAKYFPYRNSDLVRFLKRVLPHEAAERDTLTLSAQGRDVARLTVTDPQGSRAGRQGLWIQSGVHPSETTSYWICEGFLTWLLGESAEAAQFRKTVVTHVVPMANPDGVWLGNYRTSAESVEFERQYYQPYNATWPVETSAMRVEIERAMLSEAPISVLLNLHSTHGYKYPMFFAHEANPDWHPRTSPRGVVPEVRALEDLFIQRFRDHSPYIKRAAVAESSLLDSRKQRPYVEAMMHDRWTVASGPAGSFAPIMAITVEGGYVWGPQGEGHWNSPEDYREVGKALGPTLLAYFADLPTAL